MTLTIVSRTDVGLKRDHNEDSHLADNIADELVLLVVADGVGGHAFGEVASQMTVDTFKTLLEEGKLAPAQDQSIRELLLTMAAQRAHVSVSRHAQENPDKLNMSCTLTAAIADAEQATVVQVGDSRMYLFSAGELKQVTHDQTVAEELLQAGRINEEQFAKHPDRGTLVQSIGLESIDREWVPEVTTIEWRTGDLLLLCSDGLSDMVADLQIAEILAGDKALDETADALIQAALDGGGRDNVTIVLARNDA